MKRLQAFKFQIRPNGEQIRAMHQFAGNSRKVWNLALALQQKNHAEEKPFTNAFGMNNWLPDFKNEYSFLKESPSQTLQQEMKDLHRAFKNFFEKRADFPKFKKKGRSRNSFRFPQGVKLEQDNNRISLPKLGWIRYRNSRQILGEIKNVTVSEKNKKWYVAIQTERNIAEPQSKATTDIGIDMGIARFATLSNGDYLKPLNSFKTHQARLARYQRQMSKKTKFSCNWIKAKTKIQKVHERIANCRLDFLHKATQTISKNHALVCVEDLKISNMSKSAKGNAEEHGKKVRQKSGLNKSILDQGWGEFRRQLEYKLSWNGGIFIAVDPKNTSRTCPCCKYVSSSNRQTQADFLCIACGYKNHADIVGAINILERGHRFLACGEMVRLDHSMNQEPTEVIQALVA